MERSIRLALSGLSLLAFAFPAPAGAPSVFADVSPLDGYFATPPGSDFWATAVAAADADGDGDVDLAVVGHYLDYDANTNTDRVVLLRNDGAGAGGHWQFSSTDVFANGEVEAAGCDIAWGDYDGDGDQDLAIAAANGTRLLRNDQGSLTPLALVLPAYYEDEIFLGIYDLRSMSWADYDNDSDLDLLLPSAWDADTEYFRTALLRNDGPDGDGNWQFNEVQTTVAPNLETQTTWIDDDGDGDLDLFASGYDALLAMLRIERYRNDDGTLVATDAVFDENLLQGAADVADADGDGDLDIVVTATALSSNGQDYLPALRLYRNAGDGTYANEPIAFGGIDWYDLNSATWADYDSDGDVDILATGVGFTENFALYTRAAIYANDGSGSFAPLAESLPAPVPTLSDAGAYAWFDLDGDGDLDYVVAGGQYVDEPGGPHESRIVLLRNQSVATNAAPTAPVASAIASATSVQLHWQPASDDHTPSAALTYDVALHLVGTPSPATRKPELGQVVGATGFEWRELSAGTYRWEVRAVDAAYVGGPISSGTVVVGGESPLFANGFE
ncbi:MAG TPA: FG-GAP-like repeat-containing protein [Xanthomonadales bacterium]|nr:FG-GAP-like repeat-containing protein [Xanthomonadales bacterium]